MCPGVQFRGARLSKSPRRTVFLFFGVRSASWFLRFSEWLIAALLFAGFWKKKAGMLGAIGGIASMVAKLKQDAVRAALSAPEARLEASA